jgi:hypothetical protein
VRCVGHKKAEWVVGWELRRPKWTEMEIEARIEQWQQLLFHRAEGEFDVSDHGAYQ